MAENHTHIYMALQDVNPPTGLKTKILKRVETAIEQKNRNRKIIGFSIFSVSIIAFIDFAIYTIHAFQQSGFGTYASLIFTDSKIVMSNFSTFMLSLVDSLPTFAITITLISILAILISIKYATNGKKELSYAF